MKLFNSLTRQLETFVPINPSSKTVGVYACGPTVYFYPQIGNWRTFTLDDLLVRTLKYLGYHVSYVMNITDVGHLTGDNLGDSSSGEDRLEKAARREQKTAWEVAEFYTQDFIQGYRKLNLTFPSLEGKEGFCKATDHIPEQIKMMQQIETKGFTYQTTDGIYFDVRAYEAAGNAYGLMSNIHIDQSQARVEENKEKKGPRDFALWKFSPKGEKRQMEWDSPWGVGFPGWHIECSAMSTRYLGEQFDIHLGGEDHKSTHHPNEIAQAEAATGKKPFVKYWLHVAFLQVEGGRMGKSLGNAYTLQDVENRGFTLKHLRYFYLTGQYRQPLNFTWESLEQAKHSYERMLGLVRALRPDDSQTESPKHPKPPKGDLTSSWEGRFRTELEADLNMPKVLAVVWEMLRSDLEPGLKYELMLRWDGVLGFDLANAVKGAFFLQVGRKTGLVVKSLQELPAEILSLLDERETAKQGKNFPIADALREKLRGLGYLLKDTIGVVEVERKTP